MVTPCIEQADYDQIFGQPEKPKQAMLYLELAALAYLELERQGLLDRTGHVIHVIEQAYKDNKTPNLAQLLSTPNDRVPEKLESDSDILPYLNLVIDAIKKIKERGLNIEPGVVIDEANRAHLKGSIPTMAKLLVSAVHGSVDTCKYIGARNTIPENHYPHLDPLLPQPLANVYQKPIETVEEFNEDYLDTIDETLVRKFFKEVYGPDVIDCPSEDIFTAWNNIANIPEAILKKKLNSIAAEYFYIHLGRVEKMLCGNSAGRIAAQEGKSKAGIILSKDSLEKALQKLYTFAELLALVPSAEA
jgi:hypothetical protein